MTATHPAMPTSERVVRATLDAVPNSNGHVRKRDISNKLRLDLKIDGTFAQNVAKASRLLDRALQRDKKARLLSWTSAGGWKVTLAGKKLVA